MQAKHSHMQHTACSEVHICPPPCRGGLEQIDFFPSIVMNTEASGMVICASHLQTSFHIARHPVRDFSAISMLSECFKCAVISMLQSCHATGRYRDFGMVLCTVRVTE